MLKIGVVFLSLLLLTAEKVRAGKLSLTDTITWGGDNGRTGYQPTHNMDPSVVSSPQFGQLWKAVLPGNYRGNPEQIYSQPLIYTLEDDVQYVFVSTTQNNIYKINAKTGSIVASRNLHVPFLTADLDGCVDISPTVGITGTGVIDPATDTWYLTAKTYQDQTDQTKGRLNGRYYFHAIDVNTLVEQPGFPKGLEGALGSNNANRMFQSGNAHQRPALLHTGQYIYAGFASHCVQYNFTGWIMGWDKTSGELVERFTTEAGPEKSTVPGGGIWMSGGGMATDEKGSMYFSTGNGYASQLSGIPVPGRQPPTALEEAAVNMKINDDGSLKVVDFFMPWEKVQLDGADKGKYIPRNHFAQLTHNVKSDLGTTPLELLQPDVFACPNVKRMGVVIGKSGKMYILNLDNLGGYQQGPNKLDAVPQVVQNENSVYAGAGVYPLEGGYIYVNVIQYPTHVFKFSCDAAGNPSFIKVADSPEKNAYVLGVGHGTTTSLNGQVGTGLLWVSDVDGYNLRVYNAIPVDGKLQLIKTANIPGITKFTRTVFGDGRAYLGTTQGTLYCFGSPVNLPITCTSPIDFGIVSINTTSVVKTIHCQAHINTRINNITIATANFRISLLPNLPAPIDQGQNISFSAVFTPSAPGPISNDVILAVTNAEDGYATNVPISLKGTGASQAPLLAVTPNVVSFEGVITGQQAGGVSQSIIFANQGDETLHINSLDYSLVSETGAHITPNTTTEGLQVGAFTFKSLPTTIPGNSQVIININFNPATSGNFAVYVHVRTDGGTKIFDVVGTAGTFAVALLEFQSADGSGKWVQYANNSPPFTFGDVFEQQTKICKLRVTNNGSSSASSLSITVSKPPFGVSGIIGAQNGVDLGEGTSIGAGQSDTADLFCSVPKSQVNVDSYNGTAVWTMNTGDPNFGKQFIQFTCNAVTRQVGPLDPINGSAIYRYIGCWKENNPGRQMKVQLWGNDPANTNGKCISACAAQDYAYAGTQYLNECWCSNKLPNQKVDETECNYGCSGDESETCGGNGYFHDGSFISVFTKNPSAINVIEPPPGAPVVLQSIDNYNYTGCYTEGSNGRALAASSNVSENMTVENCAAFCKGFKYFGIEYSSECYCDDVVRVGSAKVEETECSMTCSGNGSEICGAGNRLTLYALIESQGYSSTLSATMPVSPTASLTSPASSSTSAGPALVSKAGAFVYQGCYTEGTNSRALSATATTSGNMSVESCATFCAGYSYMGVEYSSECYCANQISDGSVLTSTGCSMTCSGNFNEYCGGPSRLNLYTVGGTLPSSATLLPTTSQATLVSSSNIAPTTSSTSPSAVTKAASFAYQGCYTEGKSARALSTASTASGDMTVEKCAAFCVGYSYMGVEYSTECYCANSISDGAVLTPSGCSMTCGGNSNEYCGGPNRLNLYKTDPEKPTSAPTSSSASIIPISSTTTQPSNTAAGPVAVPTASTFTYQGCYTEGTSTRALSAVSTASGDMTVEKCATFCNGYGYMGTEYSTECYCANSISDGAVLTPSGCSMTCGGNSNEYCGGPNRLNLYKTDPEKPTSAPTSSSASIIPISSTTTQPSNTAAGPVAVPTASTFTYQGCYTEGTSTRALSAVSTASGDMTVEKCATFCNGYSYMGTEYSSECYCGNSISDGAVLTSSGCSMACAGNQDEYCGGPNRLSFYKVTSSSSAAAASDKTIKVSGTSGPSSLSITSTTAQLATSSDVASIPPSPSTTAPSIVQSNANFTYTACYIDSGPRTLSQLILANDRMTVEICLQACSEYTYVGLEYGRECWCDNALPSSASLSADERECNMPCAGSSLEICGNGNRLSLYTHKSQVRPVVANLAALRIVTAVKISSSILIASDNSTTSSISSIRAYLATSSSSRINSEIPTNSTLTRLGSSTLSGTRNSLPLSSFTKTTHLNLSISAYLTAPVIPSSILEISPHSLTNSTSPKHTRETTSTSVSRLASFSSNERSNSTNSSGIVRSPTILKNRPSSIGRSTLPPSSTSVMVTSTSSSDDKARQSSPTPGTHPLKGLSTSNSSAQGMPLSEGHRLTSTFSSLVDTNTTSLTGKSSASFSTVVVVSAPVSKGKPTSSSLKPGSSSTIRATFLALPYSSTSVSSIFLTLTHGSSSQSNSSSTAATLTVSSKTFTSTTLTTRTSTSKNPSSSTSEPQNPIPSHIEKNGWTYLGCVNQTSPIALSGIRRTLPADTLTVESCQSLCLKNNYGVAGLENGSICSCGNGLQSYSSTVGHLDSACNSRCNGNFSETCGGLNPSTGETYLSVWNSTSNFIIPTFVHQVGAYPRVGCFRNVNITNTTALYSGPLPISVESCVGFCISSSNQPFAYLKDGQTCYCAPSLPSSAELWDDVRCTKTCAGNSREFCGGIEGVLVYRRDEGSVVDGVPKGVNADNTPLG